MSNTAELSRKLNKAVSDVATDAARGETDYQSVRFEWIVNAASELQKAFPECQAHHALKGAMSVFDDAEERIVQAFASVIAKQHNRTIPDGTPIKMAGADRAKFIKHPFVKSQLEAQFLDFIAAAREAERNWRSGAPVVERSYDNPHSVRTIHNLPPLAPL